MENEIRASVDLADLIAAAIREKELKNAKKYEAIEQTPESEVLTWNITPRQVALINAGNHKAIEEFFFDNDNFRRIKFSAMSYIRRNRYICAVANWEDLIQQAYCDLLTGFIKFRPFDKAISNAIFTSFRFAPVGGLDEIYIFNKEKKAKCQN